MAISDLGTYEKSKLYFLSFPKIKPDYIYFCFRCNEVDAKYMCPRCNIPYCSLKCYQAEVHIQCSESFYKECVVSDITGSDLDPESGRKMMEMLQRVQQIDSQFEDDELGNHHV